jgi:hypothetical protein
MSSSKKTISTDSEINKLLKEIDFTKISQPSTNSSSGHRSKRLKFPEFSPTKSTATSKKQKTPEPPSINKSPAKESKNVKKPFVHKYIRVRSGTKTNEIPSWLENIFNKK